MFRMSSVTVHSERVIGAKTGFESEHLGNFVSEDSKGIYSADEERTEGVGDDASGPHNKRTLTQRLPNVN